MIATFYSSFAPICFTLLGLWLVVVQTRHSEWRRSPRCRNRAYAISLHFALPGLMSLLSLVDPNNLSAWRTSFGLVALVGLAAVLTLWTGGRGDHEYLPSLVPNIVNTVAAILYAVIVVVALVPSLPALVGIKLSGLEVEAITLCLLVFLGVNVAWFLMFEEGDALPRKNH